MRRFSQRNSLVTLSDINITPLLDLAFVLLIIFVITTPLLEQGMELHLPQGGRPDRRLRREDIRTVEIDASGRYAVNRRRMSLREVQQALLQAYQANKDLVVNIRGDRDCRLEAFYPVVDVCQRIGITHFSFRTEPERRR